MESQQGFTHAPTTAMGKYQSQSSFYCRAVQSIDTFLRKKPYTLFTLFFSPSFFKVKQAHVSLSTLRQDWKWKPVQGQCASLARYQLKSSSTRKIEKEREREREENSLWVSSGFFYASYWNTLNELLLALTPNAINIESRKWAYSMGKLINKKYLCVCECFIPTTFRLVFERIINFFFHIRCILRNGCTCEIESRKFSLETSS